MRLTAFIERLQASDEATKRRWLVIMAAVAMALILFLWLKYFNSLVVSQGGSSAPPRQGEGDFSLGESARGSASVIFQGLLDKVRGLGDPKEYLIAPSEGQ